MLFGAPAASVNEIEGLKTHRFDFAEIAIPNAAARRMWWESGLKNGSSGGFFLVAHGPLEDSSRDDVRYLRVHYLPNLIATVDTAQRMAIKLLTIHMSVDKRLISGLPLAEKTRALKELVEYGKLNDVMIGLENVTEDASDLEPILAAVPGLGLTLDIGHGQLGSPTNHSFEIIEKLGSAIRHVHIHDNRGGTGQAKDLHLPIGEGTVDFQGILNALVRSGYQQTVTLEMKPQGLLNSRDRIKRLLDEIMRPSDHGLKKQDAGISDSHPKPLPECF